MGWTEFALAFVAFFLSHSAPVRGAVRTGIVSRIGDRGFGLAYSALSLAVLGWLIAAAGRAPYVQLWPWAPWQLYVPLVAMLPVCLTVAFTVGSPNPFSFGGANNNAFDPSKPGIVGWMRHPLLIALAVWAAAHLVPNGDLAHVILFGCFALFAVLGCTLVDRRKQRELGQKWESLYTAVRAAPLPSWRDASAELALRIGAGLALYLGLIWLHPFLFGVSPLP